jgi:putative iron-only hydrogenase system regulator
MEVIMNNLFIMGILVDKRKKSAPRVQEILTDYGDSILSRVGIHDPGEENHGLIVLCIRDTEEFLNKLSKELEELDGVSIKSIQMK